MQTNAVTAPPLVARSLLEPVEVTRWTARLVDPQIEQDYLVDRFADDRRRGLLLMMIGTVAGLLNFLISLYGYSRGVGGIAAMIPPFASIWLPVIGLLIVQRLNTPLALEAAMVGAVAVGTLSRVSLTTLNPDLTYLWPTMIVGILFVIYLYLPLRFVTAVVTAAAFSVVSPVLWLLAQGILLPPEQMFRLTVALLFANALGFVAANSLQRSQRVQYAQSLVLRELLSTDAMTGIGNRRRFDDTYDREWRRCSRSGRPLSLLMIDVDHFKAYNDSCGHQQGDECLRLVARLLVQAVGRPGDLVARYGGEEFICLLPEVGEAGARAVAAKLVAVIEKADILHPALAPEGRLTISIGVATTDDPAECEPKALVALADKLMYAAKAAGRDQVVVGRL